MRCKNQIQIFTSTFKQILSNLTNLVLVQEYQKNIEQIYHSLITRFRLTCTKNYTKTIITKSKYKAPYETFFHTTYFKLNERVFL